MTINMFVAIGLLIFLVTFCLYTLVDRVCNCVEQCSLMKNTRKYSEKNGEKSDKN